jgi:hypothetical protein
LIDGIVLKFQQPRPSRLFPLQIVLRSSRGLLTPHPTDRPPRRLGPSLIGAIDGCRPLALGAGEDTCNPINK